MAPGGKPSCLTTLPAVRHCQSQCEPTDSQTHLQSGGDLRCPDLSQSAWRTGGLRSRRLRQDCMGTTPCMAFVVMGRGKRRPCCPIPYGGARSALPLWTRVVDMDMVRPREDPWGISPRLRPWEAWGSLMDLCGRFRPVGPPRGRATPMLDVYDTATVVVTVAAGTRCAWYGLKGPLDAEQLPPGPGT